MGNGLCAALGGPHQKISQRRKPACEFKIIRLLFSRAAGVGEFAVFSGSLKKTVGVRMLHCGFTAFGPINLRNANGDYRVPVGLTTPHF
jgi:hypothetical protein